MATKLRPLAAALLLMGTLAWAGPSRAETARFFYMGDGTLTVARGHEISHQVKDALLASRLGIRDVTIHIEPGAPAP